MKKIAIPLLVLYLSSCSSDSAHDAEHSTSGANPRIASKVVEIPTLNSGEPALYKAPNGDLLLSWIEYKSDSTCVQQFSRLENKKWSEPRSLPERGDYFVNWADFPSMSSFGSNTEELAWQYVQYHSDDGHAYDIMIRTSSDGGENWSDPFLLHDDGIAAEHGFVSMLAGDGNSIFAAWLDGREAELHAHGGEHSHGGNMTLRAGVFNPSGEINEEAVLDHKVCDCCQTDAAQTQDGPVVVYRDRNDDEVRDIYIVRQVDGKWTKPAPVFNDGWEIAGCPVNGPAIAAAENELAVIWLNGKNELQPEIKVVRSSDGGATFSKPVVLNEGIAAGRVNIVALPEGDFFAIWMEYTETRAAIFGRRLTGTKNYLIGEYDATRMGGFPELELMDNEHAMLAWTEVTDQETKVKSAILTIPQN